MINLSKIGSLPPAQRKDQEWTSAAMEAEHNLIRRVITTIRLIESPNWPIQLKGLNRNLLECGERSVLVAKPCSGREQKSLEQCEGGLRQADHRQNL